MYLLRYDASIVWSAFFFLSLQIANCPSPLGVCMHVHLITSQVVWAARVSQQGMAEAAPLTGSSERGDLHIYNIYLKYTYHTSTYIYLIAIFIFLTNIQSISPND